MTSEPTTRNPYAFDGDANDMLDAGETGGKKVFIETYGCQMNLADSELMGGVLVDSGYTSADELADADVILINTCAVRERAEDRVFGRLSHLLRFKNDKPELVLGVTGCMAEHLRDKITDQAPYVDLVIGPDAYRRLPELLDAAMGEAHDPVIDVTLDKSEVYEGLTPKRTAGISGWVTVQRGCDKFCSFCIVPFVRGRERGVPPQDILRQCRDLAERGYKEVTLLGQTVNSYRHQDTDFADLLEQIVPIEGIERIRYTSPYPTDFTPKLIETIARHDKISNYLHLPAQSGSERMLDEMRRQYTRQEYDQLVHDIREAIPDIAISTDIIVGFPGETDEDFAKTVELLESTRFDFAYLFKYSERSNTYAARNMPDDISEEVKGERLRHIIELQESISAEVFQSKIGSTKRVLVEGESKRDPNDLCGRSDDFKMTVFPRPEGRDLQPGDLVDVEITDCTSHTLLGTAESERVRE
ncbi:MAG: tRNA (N6-isopentenyl adenosine(37)-C2)-methylthiotransferase MiaB [Persicimonas sp.]